MINASMEVEIDFSNVETSAFQSLKTNLDLSDFEETVKKAQEVQVSQEANRFSQEVITASYNFLVALKEAQDTIRQAEVLANKLKQVRHMYTKMLPTNRGKEASWKNEYAENISFSNNGTYNSYNKEKDHMIELFNSQKIRELYKKADIFNNKLIQAIQKRELKTIISIVGDDGAPILYEVDMEKFIDERMRFGYSSGKVASLSANFNISSKEIADKLQSLKRLDNPEKEDVGLKETFKEILNRYKISGKRRYIMWKLSNHWWKAKVPTQGDIAEAYSYFYFSEKYHFNRDMEENVELFILKGVTQVDAISGMYQGDISLEEQIYDYAIKKGNASFLELSQMVKLTEQILQVAKNNGNIMKLILDEYDKEKQKNENAKRIKISKVGAHQVPKIMKEVIGKT